MKDWYLAKVEYTGQQKLTPVGQPVTSTVFSRGAGGARAPLEFGGSGKG